MREGRRKRKWDKEREKKRQRERETHTDRERGREREKERERERERERGGEWGRKWKRESEKWGRERDLPDIQTYTYTNWRRGEIISRWERIVKKRWWQSEWAIAESGSS